MIKSDIIERLFDRLDGKATKQEASDLIDAVFSIIKQTLADGEDVKITSFGSFKVSDKAERTGRNPQTGKPLTIVARRVVRFKISEVLRKSL